MSIKDRIQNDVKEAMRAGDRKKLQTLRLITAAIKQKEVDSRIEINDQDSLLLLDKLAKQRHESISQFRVANRIDLVEQEEFELAIINQYLPEPLPEDEVNHLIEQAITTTGATRMSDIGKVMTELKSVLQGRADMAKVSAIIKAKLS